MPRRSRFSSVGIVGTGLIGASAGLAARRAGFTVTGFDLDAMRLATALERGALNGASSFAECAARDVLVIAVPVDATVSIIERLAAAPPPAALVLDVASVKSSVAAAGKTLESFVPSHPLAGRERGGPEAATAELFDGRCWTYDPAGASAAAAAVAFIEDLGARPYPIDSASHDALVALTSHLPQLVAVALANRLGENPDALPLCGTGFRSMTRLASSPWDVWNSILHGNSRHVAQEVRALADILSEFARALEAGDYDSLEARFQSAAAIAAELDENGEALRTVFVSSEQTP